MRCFRPLRHGECFRSWRPATCSAIPAVFSNTIYTGFQVPSVSKTVTPFLESDPVLGDVDEHFSGNFLNEVTILRIAHDQGFSTAAIGKVGPTLIFDHTDRTGTQTIIVDDDATGSPKGIPLSAEMTERLRRRQACRPRRRRAAPNMATNYAGTLTVANVVQQDYFAAAVTRAILPMFKERDRPFVLMFWSRDPDGAQHFQGDSLNSLVPGINGPTSLAAIRNADDDLARIRAALGELGLLETTDIVVVADHRFFHDAEGESRTSPTVRTKFANTPAGQLPLGFVALDLARALELPLIDPDDNYRTIGEGERSKFGNGLIGGDSNSPKLVVAANGGSDLIYLPDGDKELAKRVIDVLLAQDYVSGIFVDTKLGKFPGTLTLDDIALEGAAVTPLPAIAISFRSFDTVCGEPVQCTVEIADTILQQGAPGHARLVQPRRHLEFHGHAGAGLQIALRRSGARQQRRCRPHDRPPAASRRERKRQADRPRAVGNIAEWRAARLRKPRRDFGAGRQRAHDRHQHADGRRYALFRRWGISRPHRRPVGHGAARCFTLSADYIGKRPRPRRRPSAAIQSSTARSTSSNPAGKRGAARRCCSTTICECAITAASVSTFG